MILRFAQSGKTIAIAASKVVIDQERKQVDVNQRSVWWNIYQYEGVNAEGIHQVGQFVKTVHNDGHNKKERKP